MHDHGLTAEETTALRRIAGGLGDYVPARVKWALFEEGLVGLDAGGRVAITEEGREQLRQRLRTSTCL